MFLAIFSNCKKHLENVHFYCQRCYRIYSVVIVKKEIVLKIRVKFYKT